MDRDIGCPAITSVLRASIASNVEGIRTCQQILYLRSAAETLTHDADRVNRRTKYFIF